MSAPIKKEPSIRNGQNKELEEIKRKTPNFDIKDKVFAITGASGVLCGEMARQIAALGAKVAILDLNAKAGEAVKDDIISNGGDAIVAECNVLNKESIIAACEEVVKAYGKVDVLINGAGGAVRNATVTPELSFFDITDKALNDTMSLNFTGTVLCSQVFGKQMQKQDSGCILNIASMSAIHPLTNAIAYSAAKASVLNFTEWLATYMSLNVSKNIRVNAIAPGFLIGNQNRFLLIDEKTGESTPRGAHILAQTPMGRYGTPEELVGAIVFLASEAASFITGSLIPIDGGFSVYSI